MLIDDMNKVYLVGLCLHLSRLKYIISTLKKRVLGRITNKSVCSRSVFERRTCPRYSLS